MEFRQHQLDNGLSILAEINPSAYSTSLGMFVRAGSRDETSDVGGVSHFLEHMVFKGTPTRSAEQVNLELDEMGSESNAQTCQESTIYYSTVLPEFQSRLVNLLCDMMRPSLREDDFETEKNVIIEEIKMYDDRPPYGGQEVIMADFFGKHSLSNSVLGTEQSVGSMTPGGMREYFETRYSPNNMALVAAGNVDFAQLIKDAEAVAGSWPTKEVYRETPVAEPSNGFSVLHKPQSHQQYVLQMAHAPSSSDPKRFASAVAAYIFGDDSGSRMFWEFIDTGLAETAMAGFNAYQGTGITMTYLCCEPKLTQENLERLTRLQIQLEENGFEQKELELAKRKIAAGIILASERPGSRLFAVGDKWLNGLPYESVAQVAEHYESVTLDQINDIVREFPMSQNRTLAVGPETDFPAQLENASAGSE